MKIFKLTTKSQQSIFVTAQSEDEAIAVGNWAGHIVTVNNDDANDEERSKYHEESVVDYTAEFREKYPDAGEFTVAGHLMSIANKWRVYAMPVTFEA